MIPFNLAPRSRIYNSRKDEDKYFYVLAHAHLIGKYRRAFRNTSGFAKKHENCRVRGIP